MSPSAPRAPGNSSIVDAQPCTAKPRWNPTQAKLARHVCACWSLLLLGPGQLRNTVLHLLRPPRPRPTQHSGLCSCVPLFTSTRFPQRHAVNPISSPSGGAVRTEGADECGIRQRIVRLRREAGHQPPLQVSGHPPRLSRSRYLIITFVVTRPPASRQTVAAALSKAHPRPAKTPARAHAARWWPQESSGRESKVHLHIHRWWHLCRSRLVAWV